jgi:glucan 1,3-beta-glucosidase
MHLSVIVAIATILIPSLVFAAGSIGFTVGAKNLDGSCKTSPDYEADLEALLSQTSARIVRSEAASHCETAKHILPAAKMKGFQVLLLIWYVCKTSNFYTVSGT